MLHNNKPERLIPCKYFHHSLSLKYVMFLPQLQMLDSLEQQHFFTFFIDERKCVIATEINLQQKNFCFIEQN